MDLEALYKDQYDKSLADRTEINGSLSMPIGILTALLAALYFCATNFNYDEQPSIYWWLISIAIISVFLLVVSIIYLVLAFADFLAGREYFTLNDVDRLDEYYNDLLDYYNRHPPQSPATPTSQAKIDFDNYLLNELTRNASMNQRVNRTKRALLFQSHKYMIYAIISLSLLIIPFGIDFGLSRGKEKVQHIQIDQTLPINLNIKFKKDTLLLLKVKPKSHGTKQASH